jgi:prolycopene isomerase
MEPSISVLTLYLGTDLDVRGLGVPLETASYTSWDHEYVYRGGSATERLGLNVTIPSLLDESLAPKGEHVVALSDMLPLTMGKPTPEERAQIADSMLEQAEKILPGLREHITFVARGEGDESEEYPLRQIGPIYGWDASPKQAATNRLANKTPIDGLYLVGHWTQPGHGIWTVASSGVNVARLVLGVATSKGPFPLYL